MKPHIAVLLEYFKKELPLLNNSYEWKIPEINGFSRCGERSYSANVELKEYLNKKWSSAISREEKTSLAKTVIADWGGVRSNEESTLIAFIEEIESNTPLTPIKGIASYSKLFSIVNLEKYCIYDARVAACLNAIQFNSGIRNGIAFNYVPGRNNTTGNSLNKKGFSHHSSFKTRKLVSSGWSRIKRDDTYTVYINTLNECLSHLKSYKLYDLEMVLFSNAEKECMSAMGNVQKV